MNENKLKEMFFRDGDSIMVSISVFDRGGCFDIINEEGRYM